MIEIFKKPKLEKGQRYSVELYPKKESVEAAYLGFSKSTGKHIFQTRQKKSRLFLLLDDIWIMEEEGKVTYKPVSTSVVEKIATDDFKDFSDEEKSKLLKIIMDSGVDFLSFANL